MSDSSPLSPAVLRSYQDLAVSLSYQGGALILAAFYQRKAVTVKSNELDIVTETDRQVEALLIASIRARFPHHRFIAEESHATPGHYDLTEEPTWIIDPVDGTNNFVHSLPFVCVSIGVMVKRELVVGVVHAPVLGETFTAIRGRGAFLTNHSVYAAAATSTPPESSLPSSASHRLCTSPLTALSECAVLTELGYDRSVSGIGRQLERLRALTTRHSLQSLRSYGSCALNMCYVAAGRAEAYYEGLDSIVGPKPWDSAAAAVIVLEAGGVLRDFNGGAFDMTSGRVIAANNDVVAQLIVDVCAQVEHEQLRLSSLPQRSTQPS